jgi:hypothetical protein
MDSLASSDGAVGLSCYASVKNSYTGSTLMNAMDEHIRATYHEDEQHDHHNDLES